MSALDADMNAHIANPINIDTQMNSRVTALRTDNKRGAPMTTPL